MRRTLGNCVEDGLYVGRRARDYAENFAYRRLLLERIRELARALVDLAFQTGVRLAQLRRHPIELVGKAFQFIVGAHDDLLVEVPRTDASCAFVEGADRAHHAARQRQRGHGRNHQATEQHQTGTQN